MRRGRRTRTGLGRVAAGLGLLLGLTVVGPSARVQAERMDEPIRLTVAEFNIEYGGAHVSFDKVIQAIRRGGADIVALEEAQGNTARVARALGWPYASPRLQIVSKYPLIDPPGGDGVYVFVELAPGRVVAVENVHLPSNPYGPFWVKQGRGRHEVVRKERELRLPAIRPAVHAARTLQGAGIPVFLAGDFNSPSWRDWTPAMVGVRPQIRYAVRWPVSVAVERAGFVDSFRQVHPDPRTDPGLTWWAARPRLPGWNPGRSAPQDRIDLIYAAGDATATASIVVGERRSPVSDVSVEPWPSDHRSVVSTFRVTPGIPPPFVAVDRRLVSQGAQLSVRFHAPGSLGEAVAIVPAGGDPALDAIAEQPIGAPAPTDGTLAFPTDEWSPGDFEAVLLDGGGAPLSRIPFWVRAPGAPPEISTGKGVYAVGEPIDVHWANARGERWDWVGIYHRHADPRVAYYLLWLYTGSTVEGSAILDEAAHGPWPLEAGRYSVYLLRDDGYRKVAGSDFSVTG